MKKLTTTDLLGLKGGVSVEEYCATLDQMINDNWDNWNRDQKKAATDAFSAHC
ncbi:hypothetical protein [Bacteroides acidifaciens]|jgi:hypothetical protein|uniref:hypothetical protein n=1 Tax=Bacteroides acidifaciens TaxID=85831 RepID=UPI00259B2FEB|nr:hypothetical protein [Bacteroides acidifaciens]